MSADLARFLELVELLPRSTDARLARLLEPEGELFLARAPGRLDVMGGFADYSGSLTLELPLREAAYVALQPRTEPVVRVVSCCPGQAARAVSLPLAELREHSHSYAAAHAYFRRQPA